MRKSRKKSRRKKLYGAAAKSHAKKAGRRRSKRRKTTSRRRTKRSRARARTKRTKRSRARRGIRKRPTIIVSRSGRYYRPRRSKFFKRPRRVNGRRRRRNGGGSLVRAVKNVLQVRTLTRYAALGGGIFAGTLFSRMLNTGVVPFTKIALPSSLTVALAKARPVHGILHIILGSVVAARSRNKFVQDAGVGMAALGGFDLVMQVASRLGIAGLPTFSGMNIDMLGRARSPRVAGMNIDLRGNVNLMGNVNMEDNSETHLADAINEAIS